MKHDVTIMEKKEKSLVTLSQYSHNRNTLTQEEKDRIEERKRVDKILTSDYYANKNAN